MDRRKRPPTQGTAAVSVRRSEAGRVHRLREARGPDRTGRTHRVGPGDPGHRQDVSPARGTRGNPVPARRSRAGQGRHRCRRRGMKM